MVKAIPAKIIGGFRTCGVYPFNPKAVLDHNPCVSRNNNPKSTDNDNPKSIDGDLLSGTGSRSVPVVGDDHLQQLNNGPVALSVRMGLNHLLVRGKFFTRLDTLRNMTCMILSTFLG